MGVTGFAATDSDLGSKSEAGGPRPRHLASAHPARNPVATPVTDTRVLMDDDEELEQVRQELDELAALRSRGALRPVDHLRYLDLCERERVLLKRAK
jgi:hypothetical protein